MPRMPSSMAQTVDGVARAAARPVAPPQPVFSPWVFRLQGFECFFRDRWYSYVRVLQYRYLLSGYCMPTSLALSHSTTLLYRRARLSLCVTITVRSYCSEAQSTVQSTGTVLVLRY